MKNIRIIIFAIIIALIALISFFLYKKDEKPIEVKVNETYSINLIGDEIIYLLRGEEYNEPGYILLDQNNDSLNYDVNINSNLDINNYGTYEIEYSYGNASIIRKVKVLDVEVEYKVLKEDKAYKNNTIEIIINGNDYENTLLPNNEISEEKIITYNVTENKDYVFKINSHDKYIEKVININNIYDDYNVSCNIDKINNDIVTSVITDQNNLLYSYQDGDKYTDFISENNYTLNNKTKKINIIVKDEFNNEKNISCQNDKISLINYQPGLTNQKYKDMDYWLYLPKEEYIDPNSIPIIFYFMGNGVSKTAKDSLLESIKNGKEYESIIVMPDTGISKNGEGHYDGWYKRSDDIIGLRNEIIVKYEADNERVSLLGLSNGAQGAFNVLLKNPTSFSAIVTGNGPNYLNQVVNNDTEKAYQIIKENNIGVYLIRVNGDTNVKSDGGGTLKRTLINHNYPNLKYDYDYSVLGKENPHHLACEYVLKTDAISWLINYRR